MEIVQGIKRLKSISQARLNFRRRPILCTNLYRNLMQASNFGDTFDQLFFEFFYEIFTEDACYLFCTMAQKRPKWPKSQIQGVLPQLLFSCQPRFEAGLCIPRCREGYIGAGSLCWSLTKKTTARGAPKSPQTCPSDRPVKYAGLCFKCPEGYTASGPSCVKT